MANVNEMILKTSVPSHKFTFKWIFENYSELPINWTKRSEGFSVEPESSWYVEFQKNKSYICLYLCRNGEKTFKASCEIETLNCKDEILHKEITSYENSKEFDLLPSGSYMDLFKNLPEDKVTFKILIKVKSTEPSTVCLNPLPNTTDVAWIWEKTLLRDLKRLLDNKVKTDATNKVGGETLSALIVEEEDSVAGTDLNTMKVLLSFMSSAQLDECDLETALKVYRATDKYAVSTLREACTHLLTSKMSMENAGKILYFADMHHLQELKEKTIEFITVHHQMQKQTERQNKS